jgi:hypothetical protein
VSWIQKLYETYEVCAKAPQFEKKPWPVSHTEQQAHVEIVVDQAGNFQRAALVDKEDTVIPATEKSAGRTGKKPPPHPLCDKIQYCAADYKAFGGTKEPFFEQTSVNFVSGKIMTPTPKSMRCWPTSKRRASSPTWSGPAYCIAAPIRGC